MSELLLVEGIAYLSPLPAEVHTVFSAAASKRGQSVFARPSPRAAVNGAARAAPAI
jgi:hypothetical protein